MTKTDVLDVYQTRSLKHVFLIQFSRIITGFILVYFQAKCVYIRIFAYCIFMQKLCKFFP